MASPSSVLAWKIPWAEVWQAIVHGVAESGMTDHACTHSLLHSGK